MYTTQKQVRAAFWQAWRDGMFKGRDVTPRRIVDYSGHGKMHNTDTRVAFCDFVDWLRQASEISEELAGRVTLADGARQVRP
jgi:hypothetical protein